MKRILYFVAIALLAGLVGGVYWYSSYENEQIEASLWLSGPLDKVTSMHVQIPGGSYSLLKDDNRWIAEVPGASWNIKAHTLENRIREYVSSLGDMAPLRLLGEVDRDEDGKYGLDVPDCTVILTFATSDEGSLTIKLAADDSGKVSGWKSDNPDDVYEFDGKVLDQLALPAVHFLDEYLFKFDEETVDRVQLVQPFGSSWLVEKGKSGFIFKLPGYLKDKVASSSELKLYIHALALLKASKLILEPVVADEEVAALTLRVWVKGGKTPSVVEFFPIEDDPETYLGKSSWLTVPFLLDAQSVAQLVKSAFDIQSRTVMAFGIGTVASIVIDHGQTSYVVERSDAGWRVLGGENDIPGIDMALWRFTELKFEALPLNNLSSTAVKLMHCRLLDVEGDELKAMTFYADPTLPKGQCWMKIDDGMYYPVSSRLLKDLQGMFPAVRGGQIE